MRDKFPDAVEFGRQGGIGHNGYFVIAHNRVTFAVIASDGGNWEHVSVSVIGQKRCPLWDEMKWIKEQFFSDEETVVQFHPRKSEYVDVHPFVLHLWKQVNSDYLLPPIEFV